MVHELKTWSKYFNLVKSGEKPFELRKNDRGFFAGHELLLREYNPQTQTYTGQTLRRKITYVFENCEAEDFGLKPGYCIMGLKEVE
jgi:ASC-1-like (ASCH) protein